FEEFQFFIKFKYKPIDTLLWIDNFELNEKWSFVHVKNGGRNITRGYMGKSPQLQKTTFPVSIYSQSRFYHLDCENGIGDTIISTKTMPAIPKLTIIETNVQPYTTVCTNNFDFHTMLTIIDCFDESIVLEKKRPSLTDAEIYHQGLYIKVHANVISYTGKSIEKHNIFKDYCKRIWEIYKAESPKLIEIFSSKMFDKPKVDPNTNHFAIAYYTWFRASRENQREWPIISQKPISDRSIEFPAKSGHWYSPARGTTPYSIKSFVGLAVRHDDHPEKLIPRLYKTDHRKTKNTNLHYYIEHCAPLPESKTSIPNQVKESKIFSFNFIKRHKIIKYDENAPQIQLNYNGSIASCDIFPKVITFRNLIIGKQELNPSMIKAQMLTINNQRKLCEHASVEWIQSSGPRINSIITLPWNYSQIVGDYKKLGHLIKGPLIDLTHIGIVNPKGYDIISIPKEIDNIYVPHSLETHRLTSFKYQ
ncbi:hypothetical protein COEREDRAFT_21246, partial [Coemansia reversa NRRL 1564]